MLRCCIHSDIQFLVFMHAVTDLSKDKIYAVFDMLDVDHSGLLDFDEFYLLICILIAVRVSSVHSVSWVCSYIAVRDSGHGTSLSFSVCMCNPEKFRHIYETTPTTPTGQAGEGVHLPSLQDGV